MGKTYKTEILYDVNLIQVSKGGNSQLNASFLLSNKMGISEVIAGKIYNNYNKLINSIATESSSS